MPEALSNRGKPHGAPCVCLHCCPAWKLPAGSPPGPPCWRPGAATMLAGASPPAGKSRLSSRPSGPSGPGSHGLAPGSMERLATLDITVSSSPSNRNTKGMHVWGGGKRGPKRHRYSCKHAGGGDHLPPGKHAARLAQQELSQSHHTNVPDFNPHTRTGSSDSLTKRRAARACPSRSTALAGCLSSGLTATRLTPNGRRARPLIASRLSERVHGDAPSALTSQM